MTPEKIDEWLVSIGKDRPWLADKLGISMGTLYNGFSKGFPKRSLKAIATIMSESTTGEFEVEFSAKEFERIEEARRLLGITTRKQFYEEAINEYAQQIISREAEEMKTGEPAKITPFRTPVQSSAKVAEDTAPYGSSSGKRPPIDKTGTED